MSALRDELIKLVDAIRRAEKDPVVEVRKLTQQYPAKPTRPLNTDELEDRIRDRFGG